MSAATLSRAPQDAPRTSAAPGAAYPLTRDGAEHRRLAVQAEFWADDAATLFRTAGLQAGDRVADIGCGTLHIAHALARRVGRTGRVYALDSDQDVLDSFGGAAGVPNIRPVCADAYALPWADGTLDAVHARFVAAPCGRPDVLVREMLRVVRPGGLVMFQEPAGDSWRLPDDDAWLRLRALIRAGFAARGGDFDAGSSLAQRLSGRLEQLRERRVHHTVAADHPYAALPLAFARSLADTWAACGLAGAPEQDALRARTEAALADRHARVTTFTLVQVWGRKPGDAPR